MYSNSWAILLKFETKTTKSYRRIVTAGVCIFILLTLCICPASAEIYAANGTQIPSDSLSDLIRSDPSLISEILHPGEVVFFTNSHCGACHDAEEFFHKFSPNHPEMNLKTYDLFNSTENRTAFTAYKKQYHLEHLSTPSIMVGNLTLEGSDDIQTHLGDILSVQKDQKSSGMFNFFNPSGHLTDKEEIPLLLIIGAGLLDGINPCAFAVLIIMLVNMMAQKSRRAILVTGLIYTGAVFVFYFLSGLGIFSVIQTTGATRLFSIVAGSIALVAGIIMIKDALIPTDKPTLAIPSSQAGRISRIMNMATLPAAFLLGILVGMFELPCTGGIYLSIISMISMRVDLMQSLMYLLVYNLAFVLPLLIILVLVLFGLPPERVNEWRLEQRRALRGVIGIVLIIFASYILYEVLG